MGLGIVKNVGRQLKSMKGNILTDIGMLKKLGRHEAILMQNSIKNRMNNFEQTIIAENLEKVNSENLEKIK